MKSVETASNGYRVETAYARIDDTGCFVLSQAIYTPESSDASRGIMQGSPDVRHIITVSKTDLPVLRALVAEIEKT